MNKAKTDFDKPAKDFIFILTVFNAVSYTHLVPQPGGGDIAVGLHQFLITAVHVHAYPVNRRIDFLRLGEMCIRDRI